MLTSNRIQTSVIAHDLSCSYVTHGWPTVANSTLCFVMPINRTAHFSVQQHVLQQQSTAYSGTLVIVLFVLTSQVNEMKALSLWCHQCTGSRTRTDTGITAHQILNLTCLPISPYRQTHSKNYSIVLRNTAILFYKGGGNNIIMHELFPEGFSENFIPKTERIRYYSVDEFYRVIEWRTHSTNSLTIYQSGYSI